MEIKSKLQKIFDFCKTVFEVVKSNKALMIGCIGLLCLLVLAIITRSLVGSLAVLGTIFGGAVTEGQRQQRIQKANQNLLDAFEEIDRQAEERKTKTFKAIEAVKSEDLTKALDDELKK